MSTAIQDGETILCTGDSITDCGRRDVQHQPYGCGYVSLLRDMVITREPQKNIEFINTGIGGNTVEDLRSRWIDDVIVHNPDWLTIKIGINDCNRYLTNPKDNELQSPETFALIYDEVLATTKKLLPN
ncbi:MAG: GDSL family lipase, partial [Planctomycetes bacterium]|nr:GDSL family lipase [Planctomycetota bacterium]